MNKQKCTGVPEVPAHPGPVPGRFQCDLDRARAGPEENLPVEDGGPGGVQAPARTLP